MTLSLGRPREADANVRGRSKDGAFAGLRELFTFKEVLEELVKRDIPRYRYTKEMFEQDVKFLERMEARDREGHHQ